MCRRSLGEEFEGMMAGAHGGWEARPWVMLVLVLCLVGHVRMCMGREVGDLAMPMRSGRRIMENGQGGKRSLHGGKQCPPLQCRRH